MWVFSYMIFALISSVYTEDYYELLGIAKDADNREIRRAFKKLALKLHPDKNMGEEKAHEQFIALNKAYEVLKDEELRKKYDLHGEEGLKQDFGKTWKGNYHSWNYYYESFGIYDDDPEIITLNKNDFVQSVLESSDLWFVNFYSPQCSHCHHLAPAWRELARKFEGVLQIGAVNCEEDWMLCRQQNIYSYPSLIFYPQKEKYEGPRDATNMMDYVLEQLPYNVITLSSIDFNQTISMEQYSSEPWLIFTCKDLNGCVDSDDLKKLGVILDHLVNVAIVDKGDDKDICNAIRCDSPILYYFNLNSSVPVAECKNIAIDEIEVHDLVKLVLDLLPDTEEFSEESFKEMRISTENLISPPRLVHFSKNRTEALEPNIDLKRLKALLPEVLLGQFNCQKYPLSCSTLYIQKLPAFILFKPGGSYEFHYGRITAYDAARFSREALSSQVQTLTPDHFPQIIESTQPWFIDFFAPWCPPCMQFLPHWRKASQISGHLVKFGTVDCSVHVTLCRKYNINSYPTAVIYNQTVPHKFHGSHNHHQLGEFIQDILHPLVQSLSPSSFEHLVYSTNPDEIWVVDFFAPWCGPCQQLAPEWRKLAKMLSQLKFVRIGEVDCQAHRSLCSSVGVNNYPTIRLYPTGEKKDKRFFTYSGWNRDSQSLQAWIYSFLPSKVKSLTSYTFEDLLSDEDPWVVDFYAPWCSHCHSFAPEFEKIAQAVESSVKTGKVNCDEFPRVCQSASIRAYPTVLFYRGKKGLQSQNPVGDEILTFTYNGILSFLKNKLQSKSQRISDEL